MGYDGVVEAVNKARVTGWVSYNLQDTKVSPKLSLRFYSLGTFCPDQN